MCLFEDTQLAFGHLSIHYGAHTQTVQRTSPWDCRLKICCTQQLWIALTKSTMQTHITQANLCGEQENGRVRMHSAFHMSTNLHPSESISGRYIWTCICGLMLTCAYVFALAHSSCVCLPMLLCFLYLWSHWNGTWTFCHRAEFRETVLGSACSAVFRICIYAWDNHSKRYHRLVINVYLLRSIPF